MKKPLVLLFFRYENYQSKKFVGYRTIWNRIATNFLQLIKKINFKLEDEFNDICYFRVYYIILEKEI